MRRLHPRFAIAATCLVVIQADAQISPPLPPEIDGTDSECGSAPAGRLSNTHQADRILCDALGEGEWKTKKHGADYRRQWDAIIMFTKTIGRYLEL